MQSREADKVADHLHGRRMSNPLFPHAEKEDFLMFTMYKKLPKMSSSERQKLGDFTNRPTISHH